MPGSHQSISDSNIFIATGIDNLEDTKVYSTRELDEDRGLEKRL